MYFLPFFHFSISHPLPFFFWGGEEKESPVSTKNAPKQVFAPFFSLVFHFLVLPFPYVFVLLFVYVLTIFRFFFLFFCGKNMLDVHVIPRCMMSTLQWSRPETSVCWETFCRHRVTFATKVCCARTLFKAKFLFGLVLHTLPAESETYNALVVMVCVGERSTRSTQRITERDTAQTERILTRLVVTARPG